MNTQLVTAYAVCRGIARMRAKNFYYGFLPLPKHKRNALCAVYAFMRHADDISDDSSLDPAERLTRLSAFLEEWKSVERGAPATDPVLLALADTQRRFVIPPQLLEQLRLWPLLEFESARARELYEAGDELLPLIHKDSRAALWVMMTIYRRLLAKIVERNYDVISGRVRLTPWQKVRILAQGMLKS